MWNSGWSATHQQMRSALMQIALNFGSGVRQIA